MDRIYENCIEAIQDLLFACNIFDIELYVENNTIIAKDSDYIWKGEDVFYMLFGDVLELDENDVLPDGYGIDQKLVDNVLKYKNLFFQGGKE